MADKLKKRNSLPQIPTVSLHSASAHSKATTESFGLSVSFSYQLPTAENSRTISKKLTGQEQPGPKGQRQAKKAYISASQQWPRENIDLLASNAKFHESYNFRLRKYTKVS